MVTIVQILRNKGLKPSIQRVQIYDYLKDRKDHPSIDMIYSDLSPTIPTLSKTTVYNTLKSFVKAGLAIPIMIEENEIRYDPNVHDHGHFKCESCGNVFDFSADFSKFETPEIKAFTVKERHVYFKGICEDCRRSNTK